MTQPFLGLGVLVRERPEFGILYNKQIFQTKTFVQFDDLTFPINVL
jgi:hypothetical protein